MTETYFRGSGRIAKKLKPRLLDSAPREKVNNEAVESGDKFDEMPDCVVLHILSFMETKDAVRTCVLSKRWTNLWTSIPCLNFNSKSFARLADFKKFVMWVLFRRDSSVVKVLTYCRAGVEYATDQNLFNKVIDHATSHGVEEIIVNLRAKAVGSPPVDIPLSLLRCKTLKRLELKDCHPTKPEWPVICIPAKKLLHLEHFTMDTTDISNSFASLANLFGFATLTTLNLSNLTLCCTENESLNPFENCVNLKNLHLREICFKSDLVPKDFVISAPQLNNMTMSCTRFKCKLVVSAPKLINFSYLYASSCAFFEFSMPSVDALIIDIREPNYQLKEPHQRPGEKSPHGVINMVREHHDAELSFSTAMVSCGTTVIIPKEECSPFNEWKSVNLRVGSTYKIFINNFDHITAYFRSCSKRDDFEILPI
ncbi:putative F-box/FBD/LRR-repeat protein At1g78840 [Vicia villosa]|uniref:putative F-box/FBD/LRR-repeat protein At1g78840 n=1 Tax=Vicia villosa TaxID=3911 RepID=UPI00273BF8EC|nr:putative F-box/FBD/LRR-repeat protein At1g78840 [Vicia villosa]XP_058748804.1 putative F-box/FBD/LRR-repeat protein At1g78840 [Vicia villosa]